MAKLEEITSGSLVKGIRPEGSVTIIDAKWHGDAVIELTFRDTAGNLGSRLLYRDSEPMLEVIQKTRTTSIEQEAGDSLGHTASLIAFVEHNDVNRALGPVLLESAYEECLAQELSLRAVGFQRQYPLPVAYKGVHLDCVIRVDMLVADLVVVELKAVFSLEPIHEAQLLIYLKLGGWKLGLLINSTLPLLKDGIRTKIL
jgi:GxxExxY protein